MHSQLGYIMECNGMLGELERMTQYKDKVGKGEANLTAGLFTYPCLMAADILLYDADYVPVGVDQKQHVELTRDIAQRFNNRYSDTFIVPEPVVTKVGAKIYSLTEPTKKMSKSEHDDKSTIYLLDDPKIARKKIMSAVTDSVGIIQYDPINQPGLANLLTIQSALTEEPIESIVERYQGKGYGRTLLEMGISLCQEAGCEIMTLEVRQSNVVAKSLYQSCGFEKVSVKKDYYQDNHEDADVMMKGLI